MFRSQLTPLKRLLCGGLAALVMLVQSSATVYSQDDPPASDDAPAETKTLIPTDTSTLPKLDDIWPQTAEELLRGDMEDWLVFEDETILRCEPITPRPDTLEKLQALRESPLPTGVSQEEREKARKARFNAAYVYLYEIDGDGSEARIAVKDVLRIISHEERMLWLVDEYMDTGKIREAYDMLLVIERRMPGWDKAAARRNKFLFRDAELALEKGESQTALALAEDLHGDDPAFAGLSKMMGDIVDDLVTKAIELKDYDQARFFIERLRRSYPEHPVAQSWRQKLQAGSTQLLTQATQLYEQGEFQQAAAIARHANRVWSISAQRRGAYQAIIRRFQTLRVGVLRLPDTPSSYHLPTEADERKRYLTQVRLFEPVRVTDVTYYDSGFFEEWEPRDLGRKTIFTMRQDRPYWQSQEVVTAADVVDTITNKVEPASPGFDERLASFIKSYRVLSPYEFEVEFSRVPLRTESLFSFPLTARRQLQQSDTAADVSDQLEIVSKRFVVHERDDDHIVYHRSKAEPNGVSQYHVAEVIEQKYESHDRAVQGLLRGEVDVLPHIQPWDLEDLVDDGRFFVQKYMQPVTHLIQFNIDSEVLRNRQLRQALAYSVDREGLLKHIMLRDESMRHGRVVSTPFHFDSYARSTLVPLREFKIRLAFSLTFAAKRQFAMKLREEQLAALPAEEREAIESDPVKRKELPEYDFPPMKMVCDPDPLARLAAERIVGTWKRIGINVELLPDDAAVEDGQWDLVYRTIRMEEPLTDIWPFLTLEPTARVDALTPFPDWLKQEVIDLDFVSSFRSATELLHTLHRHMAAGAHFIPLWEIDDHLVVRKTTNGFPTEPVSPYQNIERWMVRN